MQDPFRKLVQRLREEFEDLPGLRLTVREAARFWALDEVTCGRVLAALTAQGFLARGIDGRFQMYAAA
jgi:hypothetical protein